MTINEKIKVLTDHSIPHKIVHGRLMVDSMRSDTEVFEELEDVTDWSKSQLYLWLGY